MTFSVVIPSFNQGTFIERTIQSVLAQDFPDLEFLVVDGGSQDSTLSVLAAYEDRLKWISEPDRGQAEAVNKGITQTSGDLIGWLNSDDVYYPEALARVAQAFEENPDVDVIYGNAFHIDESDQVIDPYPVEDWNPARLLDHCFICQPATFFRRRTVERHGLLNPELQFCLDYEYWIRLAEGGARFLRIEHTLAGSRMYPQNKTMSCRLPMHTEINSMLRERLGRVPDRWVFNEAHVWTDQYCSRKRQLSFALLVTIASCVGSLRWNHGISKGIRRETRRWVLGNVKARLPRMGGSKP